MKIFDVRNERVEDLVDAAARIVFAGGTLVYPDETGYVLGGDPFQPAACTVVWEHARGTPAATICVASTTELLELASGNALAVAAIKRLPQRAAIVLRRPRWLASAAVRGSTLAFRVPDDPFARALLDRCGPLVTCATSYDGADLNGLPQTDALMERGEVAPQAEVSIVDLGPQG
ncbi:MAG: Sua5/YciO/YrdC/YwlC family protein [Candidatus Tyrphobacter sp.]